MQRTPSEFALSVATPHVKTLKMGTTGKCRELTLFGREMCRWHDSSYIPRPYENRKTLIRELALLIDGALEMRAREGQT